MAEYIGRLTRTIDNSKFGQPGEYPRISQNAATLNDLLAQLIGIRDRYGNIPVMQTAYDVYYEGERTELLIEGESVFEVHEAHEHKPKEAVDGWPYDGPVLEVRADL